MPAGSLITANSQDSQQDFPGFRTVGRSNGGNLVALVQDNVAALHIWTSPDGVTWTDRGAPPSAAFDLKDVFHVELVVSGGVEYLAVWLRILAVVHLYTAVSTNGILSSPNTAAVYTFAIVPTAHLCAAVYVSGGPPAWYILIAGTTVSTHDGPYLVKTDLFGGSAVPYTLWTTGTPGPVDIVHSSAGLKLAMVDFYRGAMVVLPVPLTMGTTPVINPSALETAVSGIGAGTTVALAFDNGGLLDVLYALGGATLYTVKRTGTATYSAPTLLASVMPTSAHISALHDPTSDDLWALYTSATSQANGEVVVRRRQTGSWRSALVLAGGDAAGYQFPMIGDISAGSLDTAYLYGTSGTRSLYYLPVTGGSAPSTPTNLTHGNVAGLTPVLHADYSNTAPNDGQQFYQDQVYDPAGPTLIWDSGQLASALTDHVYAGPVLTYNATVSWRRRYWDSVTAGGAGTPSPWAPLASFTPRHPASITITDVEVGGVTSASQITSPTFGIDIAYSQPDSDSASAWQAILYAVDGTTVVSQTPVTPFSPALVSGSSYRTSPLFATAAVNTVNYLLVFKVTDAALGMVTSSAALPVLANFPLPPAPDHLDYDVDDDGGTVSLSWVYSDSAVIADPTHSTVFVQYRPTGATDWKTVYLGLAITSIVLHPPPTVPYDFQIITVDPLGHLSYPAILSDITLGLQADQFGVWLTDTVDTTITAAVGAPDQFQGTVWVSVEDEQTWVPFGRTVPISSFGRTNYREATQMKWFVPNETVLSDGSILSGLDVIARLESMRARHLPLLYRDPSGLVLFCLMTKFGYESADGIHWLVSFALRGCVTPTPPVF